MEDRPLIMQFCANDPDIISEAATYAKGHCDGIDINLGCPQKIAKTGHYGAFLQDEWELIASMVKRINSIGIPVSCKIRRFEDVEKTVRYAKMIEAAGCWMLTVHGRTITQKGVMTGLADWSYIKAVRDAVSIPVIANGNIQYLADVQKCIDATGVNGVMSAEGNLHNPALFSGIQPLVWDVGAEYLQLAKTFPCPISYVRGHLFKIFHHLLTLEENFDLREALGKGSSLDVFEEITEKLKIRHEPFILGKETWITPEKCRRLPFPPWICQPYERPPPCVTPLHEQKQAITEILDPSEAILQKPSKKSLKRMNRQRSRVHKIKNDRKSSAQCADPNCPNISGNKCDFKLCKICCKLKCNAENTDCIGHRIYVKSYRPRIQREPAQVIPTTEIEVTPMQEN